MRLCCHDELQGGGEGLTARRLAILKLELVKIVAHFDPLRQVHLLPGILGYRNLETIVSTLLSTLAGKVEEPELLPSGLGQGPRLKNLPATQPGARNGLRGWPIRTAYCSAERHCGGSHNHSETCKRKPGSRSSVGSLLIASYPKPAYLQAACTASTSLCSFGGGRRWRTLDTKDVKTAKGVRPQDSTGVRIELQGESN